MTRQRTDPAVKWAINELAALKGEQEGIDCEIRKLQERQQRIQRVEQSLMTVLQTLTQSEQLAVDQLPAVAAHRRYKERGELRHFLRQALLQAYPQVIDTCQLAGQVALHFGIEFSNSQQRKAFQDNSVRNALGRLAKAGEIERIDHGHKGPGRATFWRWGQSLPTLAVLRELRSAKGAVLEADDREA